MTTITNGMGMEETKEDMNLFDKLMNFIKEASTLKLIAISGAVITTGYLINKSRKTAMQRMEMRENIEKLKSNFDTVTASILSVNKDNVDLHVEVASIKMMAITDTEENYIMAIINFLNRMIKLYNIQSEAVNIEDYLSEAAIKKHAEAKVMKNDEEAEKKTKVEPQEVEKEEIKPKSKPMNNEESKVVNKEEPQVVTADEIIKHKSKPVVKEEPKEATVVVEEVKVEETTTTTVVKNDEDELVIQVDEDVNATVVVNETPVINPVNLDEVKKLAEVLNNYTAFIDNYDPKLTAEQLTEEFKAFTKEMIAHAIKNSEQILELSGYKIPNSHSVQTANYDTHNLNKKVLISKLNNILKEVKSHGLLEV